MMTGVIEMQPRGEWRMLAGRGAALLLCAALLLGAGCRTKTTPMNAGQEGAESSSAKPLRLMVVDDAPLAEAIQRHWRAHFESELLVTQITTAQAAAAQQLPVDVVIYAPALMGQFAAEEMLLPLDENLLGAAEYQRDDLLPGLLRGEASWGGKLSAVPLGSPQLVLMYRSDWLAAAGQKPPQTWEEYDQLVEKFREPPAGVEVSASDWRATAEPIADGWAAKLLLARGAASARHRDQLSSLWTLEMEPLIASPPWTRALTDWQASRTDSKEARLLSPPECLAKLLSGECALAITWPQALPENFQPSVKAEQIGLAPLPGSRVVYHPDRSTWEPLAADESPQVATLALSGRVASVSRATAQPDAARRFLLWLTGPSLSGTLAPASSATTVFRGSHFRSMEGWRGPAEVAPFLASYGEIIAASEDQPRNLLAPRLPGQDEYLAALDRAVLSALKSDQTPEAALQQAAGEWRETTEKLDIAKQRRALRASLGIAN